MALLSKAVIKTWLDKDFPDRLVITPILDPEVQIDEGAVDLRLGTTFILTRKAELEMVDATREGIEANIQRYQTRVAKRLGEKFVLHPSELVLGVTLEYLSFPAQLGGYVLTRSSWGRLGLIIATATFVNPGFKGCLTLELLNLGEAPIVLYPGIRVAQLVLHGVEVGKEPGSHKGRYQWATEPEFSRIYADKELRVWAAREKAE